MKKCMLNTIKMTLMKNQTDRATNMEITLAHLGTHCPFAWHHCLFESQIICMNKHYIYTSLSQ
jgi:hypothetical protein